MLLLPSSALLAREDEPGHLGRAGLPEHARHLAQREPLGVDVVDHDDPLAGDPLGQMTLGEGTIVNGSGVQRTTNSRWGDYTDMTVDPVDDCTFWYVNEYYTAAGQASSTAGWQTRIASFKLPGC